MIVTIIILSTLLLVVGILAYINYIKYRKALAYAERVLTYSEAYVRFIEALWIRFQNTKEKLDQIDRKGSFKADDEVGFTFTEIQEAINDLYEFIIKYVNREDSKDKEIQETKKT